jgi:hypothetical protein
VTIRETGIVLGSLLLQDQEWHAMDGSQLVEILGGLIDHGAWRRLIVSASSSAETD